MGRPRRTCTWHHGWECFPAWPSPSSCLPGTCWGMPCATCWTPGSGELGKAPALTEFARPAVAAQPGTFGVVGMLKRRFLVEAGPAQRHCARESGDHTTTLLFHRGGRLHGRAARG